MPNEIVFEAELDGKKFKGTLRELEEESKKFGNTGKKSFEGLNKSSLLAAGGIGAVALALTSVVNVLSEVSRVAAGVFKDLITRGVELNQTFELSETILGQALGDPELGKAAVKVVDELAEKFRANKGAAQLFAQSILPRSDSLETFTELLRLTDIQADVTGKSFKELGFSIKEAISGDFRSLKEQFDVGPREVEQIKELAKEIGFAAATAKVLGDTFDALGKKDIGATTLGGAIKDLQIAYDNFAQRVGEPVFDELKDQINAVLEAIDDNQEGINRFASALGDLAAAATRLVGTELEDLINNLDFASIEQGIDNITRLVNAISGLIDITLFGIQSGAFQISFGLATGQTALTSAGIIKAVTGDYESLGDVMKRINAEQTQLETDLQNSIKDRGKTEEDVTKDVTDRINQQLKSKADLVQKNDEVSKSADKIAKAEERAMEAREDAAKRGADRLIDIEIDIERARLKILRDSARDAVAAERDRLRDLEDIRRDHTNDIADAERDLGNEQADIARNGARDRVRIERQLGQARLDARIEFERQIANVQRQFEQSAVEAAINVDAQAFVRAQRERNNQIEDAKTQRDNRIHDAELTAQREREAQREAQRQAVEDAKIEFNRRVEEFRLSLQREIEEANIANQRKLEDIRIAEQIKLQELAITRQQEIDDAARANQIQLEAIETRLQREIAAVSSAAKAKADIEIAEAKRSAAEQARIAASVPRGRSPRSAGGGTPILHDGGFLGAGQTALVQNNERFFTPSQSGFVATPQQFSPAARAFGNSGSSVTNNTVNAGFDPGGMSNPETALMVENMVRRVMVEELR